MNTPSASGAPVEDVMLGAFVDAITPSFHRSLKRKSPMLDRFDFFFVQDAFVGVDLLIPFSLGPLKR